MNVVKVVFKMLGIKISTCSQEPKIEVLMQGTNWLWARGSPCTAAVGKSRLRRLGSHQGDCCTWCCGPVNQWGKFVSSVISLLKTYCFDKSQQAKVMFSWGLWIILLSISTFSLTVGLLQTFALPLFRVLFFSYKLFLKHLGHLFKNI